MSKATKQSPIRIAVFPVDARPYITEVANTLPALQAVVKGHIEMFPVSIIGAVGICNEEGALQGMARNFASWEFGTPVCGTFFLCGDCDEAGWFLGLSDQQVSEIEQADCWPESESDDD